MMANRNQEGIQAYQFKEGLHLELEIVSLSDLYRQHSEMITRPHRTGFYHIFWYQNGPAEHMVDFKSISIQPNSLLFLNKDTVQIYDKNDKLEGKVILFTEKFFCRALADSRYLKTTVLFHDLLSVVSLSLDEEAQQIRQYFDLMHTELKNPADTNQDLILKNFLHNLLLSAERVHKNQGFKEPDKGPDLDHIVLFNELLENQYKTHKRVADYARKMGVTEKRLNLATSRVLGKQPKQLIDERVMLEAKRLLAHSKDSIKEIGFELGFEEPTNFIKYFRKHNLTTPATFRASFL